MKIGKIFKKNIKKEERKQFLLWFLVFLFMFFLLIIWFFDLSRNVSDIKNINLSYSPSVDFSEISEKSAELNRLLEEGRGKINELESQLTDDYWLDLAEKKIDQSNLFENDEGFYELRVSDLGEENKEIIVKFDQYYKNVLIENGYILVYFDSESSEFVRFEDNLKREIEIGVDPQISAKKASEMVLDELDEEIIFNQGVLVIVEYEEEYYLVWKLDFKDSFDSHKEFLVGAKNGNFLPQKIDS